MAVTGTSTFTLTRDEVINSALRALGVLGTGETLATEDFTNCSEALNLMMKSWAKKGLPLWVTQEIPVPMIAGVGQYPLGPGASFLQTAGVTLTLGGSGAVDGVYALGISDVGGGTGATGDYTISGGIITSVTITSPGSGYITPVLGFPDGLGDIDITIQPTGLSIPKPLKIIDGTFIRNSAGNDTTLLQISRKDYDTLGSKTSAGTPNQFYYDTQRDVGQLFLMNVPSDSTQTIHAQIQRQFFDMTAGTDNFDFPQEWLLALKWGLAAEVATEYGIPMGSIQYFEGKSQAALEECFGFSVEEASVMFTVDTQGQGRGYHG